MLFAKFFTLQVLLRHDVQDPFWNFCISEFRDMELGRDQDAVSKAAQKVAKKYAKNLKAD